MSKRVAMSEKPDMVHDDHTNSGDLALGQTGTRVTDNDKGSSRYADSEAGLAHREGLAKAERRLLLKLGKSLLATPCLELTV